MSVFSNNLLLGAGGQSTGLAPFDPTLIGNSVWFNGTDSRMDSPSFSAQSDPTCFTFATWVQILDFSISPAGQYLWSAERTGNYASIRIDNNNKLIAYSNPAQFTSDMLFRDAGWYHIICSYKGSANTVRMFVNGVEITNTRTNSLATNPEPVAFSHTQRIGAYYVGATGGDLYEANSYMAQTVFLDGFSFQDGDITVSDFLDTFTFGTNGSQFIPKKDSELATLAGTAGANSYVLDYADSADLGNDISSNANDFTPTSMSSTNQSTNTPSLVYPKISNIGTPSGDAAANYTMGLGSNRMVYSGANQGYKGLLSTQLIQPDDSPIYWEYYLESGSVGGTSGGRTSVGLCVPHFNVGNANAFAGAGGNNPSNLRGVIYDNGSQGSTTADTLVPVGGIQNLAYEPSTGKIWFGLNGTWSNGSEAASTTLNPSGHDYQATVQDYVFFISASRSTDIGVMNFGDNPTMSGNITAGGNADENGYGNFKYAVPSGFLAPNSANLTAPDYQGIDYFTSTLYQGNGTGQRVGDFVPFTDAYTVANSAMFQHDEVRALSRTAGTPSSTGGKKGTWSVWYKTGVIDTDNIFFDNGTTATNRFSLQMDASGQIAFIYGATSILQTSADLKGGGLWRNLVLKVDTSLGTAADRAIMYIDGVEVTSFATDNRASLTQDGELGYMDSGATQFVGSYNGVTANQWDGYLAETIFLDNQFLSADSFGQLDTSTNKWVPKDISGLTLGDQGFYLEYGGSFGTGNGAGDSTGNSNNLTEIGTWATTDQFVDTPSKNYNVFDPTYKTASSLITVSEGNLQCATTGNDCLVGTIHFPVLETGCYWEAKVTSAGDEMMGLWVDSTTPLTNYSGGSPHLQTASCVIRVAANIVYNEGVPTSFTPSTISSGDILMFAYKNGQFFYGKNGSWENSGDPESETGELYTIAGSASKTIVPVFGRSGGSNVTYVLNFGQQSGGLSGSSTTFNAAADGYFVYTPPTGYKALNQDNLDDTASKITALAWIKNRDAADDNIWMDRVIGTGGYLSTTQNDSGTAATAYGDGGTDVLTANTNAVQRFLQRGVQIGSDENVNTANESYVLWQWLLGDSATTGSSITTGSPSLATTGIVSDANHFSIVQYTGNGTDNATFAHGLGSTPNLVMIKRRSGTALNSDWVMHVVGLGTENYIYPHYRIALSSGAGPNGMVPDADLVEISTGVATNTSGQTHMAYSFKNTPGLCKIGTYIGNSSANGTYVSTGFRPSWLWIFNTTLTSADAERPIIDTARYRFNGATTAGGNNGGINFSDQRAAEEAQSTSLGVNPAIDILSEGFKLRANDSTINTGTTYMYICMADIAGNGTLPPIYGR